MPTLCLLKYDNDPQYKFEALHSASDFKGMRNTAPDNLLYITSLPMKPHTLKLLSSAADTSFQPGLK